jgi:NAD(P)-dependent dehydrogenase (short-subunit alcohol dehydrogenase family)
MQKVATVTGAARGIGLTTVKRFLVDGWRVALLDIDEETLNRSAADLHTDAVLAICCDVADAAAVAKAFAAVAQTFGRLDVLVNNAGIAIFKPILNVTYEEWSRVLAVNLTGPFLCTQAAAPLTEDEEPEPQTLADHPRAYYVDKLSPPRQPPPYSRDERNVGEGREGIGRGPDPEKIGPHAGFRVPQR